MGKLTEKFKSMKRQEKVMLLFIILLIIAVITRWSYVTSEVGESFRHRFSPADRTEESKRIQQEDAEKRAADTLPEQ